jgi:glycosyltransferase involved in cell wall biosynthesis
MRSIEVICHDGSPLGIVPQTLWGDGYRIGLGGSEYLLITLCEAWAEAGHRVILYNNPHTTDRPNAKFEQRSVGSFDIDEQHDIVIAFRSPNPRVIVAKANLFVWLSCDQSTIGDFAKFSRCVNKIVCISEFHRQYFQVTYNIVDNVNVIDIPVRYQDFEQFEEDKIPNRFIFTSVPARGLDNLCRIWDKIIQEIPDASLAITSDYRLWGSECGAGNEQFRLRFLSKPNVLYFGALSRADYIKELMKAQVLLYPSNYDELFCVSVAEAQALGVYPVTSSTGALFTTNIGSVIVGSGDNPMLDRLFIERAVELVRNPELLQQAQDYIKQHALERFSLPVVMKKWNDVLEIE